jgi:hypothetical protein
MENALKGPWIESVADWRRVADRLSKNDPALAAAAAGLARRAGDAAAAEAESVVDKVKRNPPATPSNDPHDYASIGSYWWPDPAKPGGVPYVLRDGELTPDAALYDRLSWDRTAERIAALATSLAISPDEKKTDALRRHVRTWFLDPATRMNPHMNHAQFVPGRNAGSPIGVIDLSIRLPLVLDRLAVVETLRPGTFTEADRRGLRDWCAAFFEWLLTDPVRKPLQKNGNNHSVYYDRLTAYLALSLGRDEFAQQTLSAAYDHLVADQVEPDGAMPRELGRTRSLAYCLVNLIGLLTLARMAEQVGVRLWGRDDREGRSVQRAASFVFEKLCSGEPWPYQQIVPAEPMGVLACFRYAGNFSDQFDLNALKNIDGPRDADAVLIAAPLHPFR